MPEIFLLHFLQAAAALPHRDWLSHAMEVAQVLLVPIATALLGLMWQTWKRVTAVWVWAFGNPLIESDRGFAGREKTLTRLVGRIDRDIDIVCERAGIERPPMPDE